MSLKNIIDLEPHKLELILSKLPLLGDLQDLQNYGSLEKMDLVRNENKELKLKI
jgi:hypothetical protein